MVPDGVNRETGLFFRSVESTANFANPSDRTGIVIADRMNPSPLAYKDTEALVTSGFIAAMVCLGIGVTFGVRRRRFLPWPKLAGWSIPFAYCISAVVLGGLLPRLEHHLLPGLNSSMTVAAAMTIYSAIATGMITLTGIVFSLVFVMVQFSSTAYSPRLVLWISRDPLMYHAMGVFTATFIYAIAAIAWIDRSGSGRVPFVSVWIVMALLMASVGVFVALVHRVNRLQINNVLNFTGDFGRRVVESLYPPLDRYVTAKDRTDFRQLPVTQALHYSGSPRTIQALDMAALTALAESSGGVVEMTAAVGDTLVESTPLLRVFGGRRTIRESAFRHAIHTGTERTFEQDPKYVLRLLVDIAIRALSPAVNDPSTAVQALDQIEDLLVRIGRRRLEIGEIRNKTGVLRLVMPVPSWEDFLNLAFEEIRVYGAAHPVPRGLRRRRGSDLRRPGSCDKWMHPAACVAPATPDAVPPEQPRSDR